MELNQKIAVLGIILIVGIIAYNDGYIGGYDDASRITDCRKCEAIKDLDLKNLTPSWTIDNLNEYMEKRNWHVFVNNSIKNEGCLWNGEYKPCFTVVY